MTALLDVRAAPALLQGYVAPAAELVALATAVVPSAPTLVAGHFCGVLLSRLQQLEPQARFICLESMSPPVLARMQPGASMLYGRALPLPVKAGIFGAAAHGLAFGDPATDTTMLRETARSLLPGGVWTGAFLGRGTFDALLDAVREAGEVLGIASLAESLEAAESNFRAADNLRSLAGRAGFVDLDIGQEEHSLNFGSAQEFLADSGVDQVLLRHLALTGDGTRERVLDHVLHALQTYFGNGSLHPRVVTLVIKGTRA